MSVTYMFLCVCIGAIIGVGIMSLFTNVKSNNDIGTNEKLELTFNVIQNTIIKALETYNIKREDFDNEDLYIDALYDKTLEYLKEKLPEIGISKEVIMSKINNDNTKLFIKKVIKRLEAEKTNKEEDTSLN